MKGCLTEDKLELLLQGGDPWWRRFFWRRHLRGCRGCQERLRGLHEDDQLLNEIRQAVAAVPKPSPLSAARSKASG